MNDRKIISVLIGLANACNNNPKTAKTDEIVLKSLAFSSLYPDADKHAIDKMIAEITEEKRCIAPDCFRCMNSCGNTSDYDMDRINQADEEIRQSKYQILDHLQEIARILLNKNCNGLNMELIYHALSFISYDLEADSIQSMLKQVIQMKQSLVQKEGNQHVEKNY